MGGFAAAAERRVPVRNEKRKTKLSSKTYGIRLTSGCLIIGTVSDKKQLGPEEDGSMPQKIEMSKHHKRDREVIIVSSTRQTSSDDMTFRRSSICTKKPL